MIMITDKQLYAFTQFMGDTISKDFEKNDLISQTGCYFGVCPKEAMELVTRCEDLEYIERTDGGYMIRTT